MIEYYKNFSLENLFYIDENGIVQEEIFKDIPNYEGIYQISDLGRRRNKMGKICKSRIKKGYNTARLCKNKIYKEFLTHRLVADAFILNPKNKPHVNHLNGIKSDNRVENLEWVTESENALHSYKNNLQKPRFGKDNNLTKLTEEQVLEIRKLYSIDKYFQKDLAEIYNVTLNCVWKIVSNKTWKHIL